MFSFQVLGSLSASIVAGVFMLVQGWVRPTRRLPFWLFGMVWLALAVIDTLPMLGGVPYMTYERIRIAWCGAHAASLLLLFGVSARRSLLAAALTWGTGALVTFSDRLPIAWLPAPDAATSLTFPITFAIGAECHRRLFRARSGYASCMLWSFSSAFVVMCACYVLVFRHHPESGLTWGYLHYAQLSWMAVLLGWVHWPRELEASVPVRVPPRVAAWFFAGIVGCELAFQPVLLLISGAPQAAAALTLIVIQSAIALLLYFQSSHQLVIYTDNVTGLLEERTASLREAGEKLEATLAQQSEMLDAQAREIRDKAEVISRQRRLELAAQTAGQAAHDIQNLISPMRDRLAQLEEDANIPPAALDGLRRHLEELLDLNSQLLTLARRGRLVRSPVDLGELVLETRERFPERVQLHISEPVWVCGAWSQLTRALSNLIRNALDASPEQTPVEVRLDRVIVGAPLRCHLGFLPPGTYARLEVRDHGPGIPEPIQERIFEPFFSEKSGDADSGTGLGLSIVTAVLEDHGGVLDLESGADGTAFALYLAAIEAPGALPDAAALCGSETVVVTDDDSQARARCVAKLSEAGYHVLEADDGDTLLRLLQVQQVDLILLDLKMRRIGGRQAFMGALHLRPGARVVVHSSHVTSNEATELLAMGAAAILAKPASRLELLSTVREVLDEAAARGSQTAG